MSAEKLEIEAISGAALIVLIVLAVLGYLAWRNISLPSWAYPNEAWGNLSTGVDKSLNTLGLSNTPTAGSVDDFLGRVFGWLTDNLPNPPASKLGTGDGTGGAIQTGSDQGNQSDSLSVDDFDAAPPLVDQVPLETLDIQGQPLGV